MLCASRLSHSLRTGGQKASSYWALSCQTGKAYAEHWGHGVEIIGTGKPGVNVESYTIEGGIGFKEKGTNTILLPATFEAASSPMIWKEKIYAWVKEKGRWHIVWFNGEPDSEAGTVAINPFSWKAVDMLTFEKRFQEAVDVYNTKYWTDLGHPLFYSEEYDRGIALYCEWPSHDSSISIEFSFSYDKEGLHLIDDS